MRLHKRRRLGKYFWLSKFFPKIHAQFFSVSPPIDTVCEKLSPKNGWTTEIVSYLLPHDAIDMTMHSGWNKPEIYLDKSHRQSMSGFALASSNEVETGLAGLRTALKS